LVRTMLLDLISLWHGQHARTLLHQAQKDLDAGRHADALDTLTDLRSSYVDVPFVTERMSWIEENISVCSRKTRSKASSRTGTDRPKYRICSRCSGTGKIRYAKKRRVGAHYEIYEAYKTCPACGGAGRSYISSGPTMRRPTVRPRRVGP